MRAESMDSIWIRDARASEIGSQVVFMEILVRVLNRRLAMIWSKCWARMG